MLMLCLRWNLVVLHVYYFSGITEDDLRETAYEVLLASAGASGWVFYFLAWFGDILLMLIYK